MSEALLTAWFASVVASVLYHGIQRREAIDRHFAAIRRESQVGLRARAGERAAVR